MDYLLLLAAIALFYLSYSNYAKFNKFKDTGKIPVLIAAKQNTNLYLILGLFSIAAFLIISFR